MRRLREPLTRRSLLQNTTALGSGLAVCSAFSSAAKEVPLADDSAEENRQKSPRPFYLIGHDPNTIEEAEHYLCLGANALEPDINVFASHPHELCVDHGPGLTVGPGSDNALSVVEYLTKLRTLAGRHPNLTLVYFDCKELVATPAHGRVLMEAIRVNLIGEGSNRLDIDVIISVARLREKAIFQDIAPDLRPREALMIDQENDPTEVSDFFNSANVKNQCFSNGISVENAASCVLAPHIHPSIAKACAMRDSENAIKFVTTWTVNSASLMTKYIKLGVNGIIVDRTPPAYNPGEGLSALVKIVGRDGKGLGIRKAMRRDSVFA